MEKNLIELASRLRDRSMFVRQPNNKAEVFIGSSSEGLRVAKLIFRHLKYRFQ